MFDDVTIAILINPGKQALFTVEERVEIIREAYKGEPRVTVDTFSGLLVDYAERVGAAVIVRGLRAISDFEYEFQMALMNRRLNPRIETVFMMPAEGYSYLSSRLVKEVFQLGGRVRDLVPPIVERRLAEKYGTTAPPAAPRAASAEGAVKGNGSAVDLSRRALEPEDLLDGRGGPARGRACGPRASPSSTSASASPTRPRPPTSRTRRRPP